MIGCRDAMVAVDRSPRSEEVMPNTGGVGQNTYVPAECVGIIADLKTIRNDSTMAATWRHVLDDYLRRNKIQRNILTIAARRLRRRKK